ncbi:MAG: alpha-L-fucosidase [Armatimonadota bacterium]|jgi:alpha-L-fucosidase
MPDMRWWREARFGMFIHWGIYAVAAGRWKGEHIQGLGEWVMYRGQIPVEEYETLAGQFNPVKFDAEEWVALAERAGMKYLVITAKHHDGFAMFDSAASEYDIVDATPYGRDIMADLAEACHRHGIRLCFYYSQAQDWHHPGGEGHWDRAEHWQTKTVAEEEFAAYLEEKAKPQVRELLTQYGPIGLIWFDTPVAINPEQSQELVELVHELQPECLVNGRVGNEKGDYSSLGDNQIPRGPVKGDWETPATINDTWGFKVDDDNWKSTEDLLRLLVDLASKGVNYLLNVGPTAEGVIPPESVERLEEIGAWMDVNSEAIYTTEPNPWPWEFEWGRVTVRPGSSAEPGRLFLHMYDWPGRVAIAGLRNNVTGARLLSAPGEELDVAQIYDPQADLHLLSIDLPPRRPDEPITVVEVTFEGEPDVDTTPAPQTSGAIVLPGYLADFSGIEEAQIDRSGVIRDWRQTGSAMSWTCVIPEPGEYEVQVVLGSHGHRRDPQGGQTVTVSVAGEEASGTLTTERRVQTPRAQYYPEYLTPLGTVAIAEAGRLPVTLTLDDLGDAPDCTLAEVRLVPVD